MRHNFGIFWRHKVGKTMILEVLELKKIAKLVNSA